MSAAADALRGAQRLLRAEASRLPTVEVARDHYDEDPTARGLRRGANLIEALIPLEEQAGAAPSPAAEREAHVRVARRTLYDLPAAPTQAEFYEAVMIARTMLDKAIS